MLRTDLIEVINRGDTWAFVGSGVSIDAGGPSWAQLVENVVAQLEPGARQQVLGDERFRQASTKKQFPKCFSRIETIIGRQVLEGAITARLETVRVPGKISHLIADWPFAGYITTNHDGLCRTALRNVGEKGWIQIGNSPDEIRKVAGNAKGLIWHVHGAIGFPPTSFRMVLSENDYDDLYLDASPVVFQLRGLLAHRRFVFVGFGFEDPELMRLLKLVGRYCNPACPAFAFLSGLSGSEHESKRLELLEKYNVDVIPYREINGSHEPLLQALDVYSAFILRRSLRFGQAARPCPSYDPETTGLLVYNQLVLRQQGRVEGDVLGLLLRARILSLLQYRGSLPISSLLADLAEKFRLVGGRGRADTTNGVNVDAVQDSLKKLVQEGFVNITADLLGTSVVSLSPKGSGHVAEQSGVAERISGQFSSSLLDRALRSFPQDQQAVSRIAQAAESFLKECVKRRALGVAMSWYSPRTDFQEYHMVGLLQALPEFMSQLRSPDEGLALVRLVQDVLAKPSDAESTYLGTAIQAQFGVNLLGYDPETVNARARELARTLFLIDSSTLIPLLARSSVGYPSARLLLDRLEATRSAVATTDYLTLEVAEHARWAISHLGSNTALFAPRTIAMATGRAGSRSNAFLEGFLEEINRGGTPHHWGAYLDSVCGHSDGHTGGDTVFFAAIQNAGVPCFSFNKWEGFTEELWAERDTIQGQIAERRSASNTYKHERQVKAEAEALLIINNLRKGAFKFNGQTLSDAWFVSHTRAIDEVAGSGLPITMRPQAVIQWLSTVTACAADELSSLVNGLLWELSERGLAIIDRTRIQTVFSPLIVASKEKLQEELESHRVLIARRYGEDASKAFNEVSDLELPVVLESFYAQKAAELEMQLKKETATKEALKAQAQISGKDRQRLAILEAKQKARHREALSKKRAAASRPGKKKTKKKKK